MNRQLRADLSLLLVTAVWGISFSLMRNVLDHMPAIPYLALRFTTGGIVLAAVYAKKLKYINKNTLIHGSMIGLFIFLGMLLQVYGLYYTTASNSAFITGLNVVLVPIFLAIFFKKKTERLALVGIILATIGLFLISGIARLQVNIGDLLTLVCAASFAFHIIFIDKFIQRNDPELLGVIQVWAAAALYLLIWGAVDRTPININWTVIIVLLITGVMGTAFAFLVQTKVQKDTTPAHTALILTIEPIFGAVFALIIPDTEGNFETMTIIKVIGCILILAGTLVSEYKTIRKVKQ